MRTGSIFKTIRVFFRKDGSDKKIMVVGDNKPTQTAENWAGSPTSLDLPNDPFTGTVVDIDYRGNGGRAWKVEWRGFLIDLREEELLFCLKDKGIGPGGKILNELVWGRQGSQTKVLPVGSPVYNEILASSLIKDKKNKIKPANLMTGNVFLSGKQEYKLLGRSSWKDGNRLIVSSAYPWHKSGVLIQSLREPKHVFRIRFEAPTDIEASELQQKLMHEWKDIVFKYVLPNQVSKTEVISDKELYKELDDETDRLAKIVEDQKKQPRGIFGITSSV